MPEYSTPIAATSESDSARFEEEVLQSARESLVKILSWLVVATAVLVNFPVWFSASPEPTGGMPTWIYHGFWILVVAGIVGCRLARQSKALAIFLASMAFLFAVPTLFLIGPWAGTGAMIVATIVMTELLLGERAGWTITGAFILTMSAHLLTMHQRWLPTPTEFPEADVTVLIRIYVVTASAGLVSRIFSAHLLTLIRDSHRRILKHRAAAQRAEIERLEAQQRVVANQHFEAMGRLAGGVAHDMNNALTTILCSAELLQEELKEPIAQELASDIILSSRNAAGTTRQLLSLNRRTTCLPQLVSVDRTLHDACRLASRIFPENIDIRIQSQTEAHILVDPADFQQALLNLMINARDAMPDGGVLTVRSFTTPHHEQWEGPAVGVDIEDTGIGISPEDGARLFEPFFSTKPEGKGTGLGLAVVHAFINDAGGHIDWKSSVGHGSRFQLWFPQKAAPSAANPTERHEQPPVTGGRILLLEDQEKLRKRLAEVLRRGGFEVQEAADTGQAYSLLDHSDSYQLLCSDIMLPGSHNSQEFLHSFQERHPQTPILLISGYTDETLQELNLRPSAQSHFMRKPFTGMELLSQVQKMLSGQTASNIQQKVE